MRPWDIILAAVLVLLLFIAGLLVRTEVRTPGQVAGVFALWVAEGFGVGRIPWAPGTFGSVVGIAWFWVLLAGGGYLVFMAGLVAGIALSVWLCGVAEERLGKKDPSSVVLDEISAMPLCFVALVWLHARHGGWPEPAYFFSDGNWLSILGVFAAFRLFDVWKPWPVHQSQALPRGWGITVDDQLAALYVNAATLIIWSLRALFRG
ncbi:MAG: phosphatidylglycerophosphatase A family protein [Limisphaerales bacterium]